MMKNRTTGAPAAAAEPGTGTPRGKTRGQAMVEFTLLLPLILMLAIGILEFGMLFKDHMGIHYASRAGARVGVEASQLPDADCSILRAISTTMSTMEWDHLERVELYRADDTDNSCSAPCHRTTYIRPTQGSTAPECDANNQPGGDWVPYAGTDPPYPSHERANLDDRTGNQPDGLGIAIQYTHRFFFNYVPGADTTTVSIRDVTVMQIEPMQFRPIPPTPTP